MSLTSWRNPGLAEESRFVHSMTRLILKQNKEVDKSQAASVQASGRKTGGAVAS